MNGQSIKDPRELARTIGSLAPGNAVKLNVLHKGKDEAVNLTLGQLPATQEANADSDHGSDVPRLGLTVAPASSVAGAGKNGVVITEVYPKSAAADRGFKEGVGRLFVCNAMTVVGTTRTWRGGPSTSAVGGRTDMPFKRADFRV